MKYLFFNIYLIMSDCESDISTRVYEDETSQDETSQDETSQDKSSQDETSQDKSLYTHVHLTVEKLDSFGYCYSEVMLLDDVKLYIYNNTRKLNIKTSSDVLHFMDNGEFRSIDFSKLKIFAIDKKCSR